MTAYMKSVRPLMIAIALAVLTRVVFSHDGKPHDFDDLIRTWSFDPLVVILLTASAVVYIAGLRSLWRASGTGGGISASESLAFAGGWTAAFIALVSPLHPWGEVLFSAHMTQHELLMLVAAPLFVLGRPFIAAMWFLPQQSRMLLVPVLNDVRIKKVWRFMTAPFAAWAIHAAALWIWHIPALFQATLHSDVVHTFQHASFFSSALLFWWSIIYSGRGAHAYGASVLYLFTTSLHSGMLGVLLTLSSRVLYPAYSETTQAWGLTPLEDQQVGGLIMWIPAGIVYMVAGLVMFAAWLHRSESARKEQPMTATGL